MHISISISVSISIHLFIYLSIYLSIYQSRGLIIRSFQNGDGRRFTNIFSSNTKIVNLNNFPNYGGL